MFMHNGLIADFHLVRLFFSPAPFTGHRATQGNTGQHRQHAHKTTFHFCFYDNLILGSNDDRPVGLDTIYAHIVLFHAISLLMLLFDWKVAAV